MSLEASSGMDFNVSTLFDVEYFPPEAPEDLDCLVPLQASSYLSSEESNPKYDFGLKPYWLYTGNGYSESMYQGRTFPSYLTKFIWTKDGNNSRDVGVISFHLTFVSFFGRSR